MMRVLIWTELYPPLVRGGAELLCGWLADELCRSGLRIEVVTDGGERFEGEERDSAILVHRFPFQSALTRKDLGGVAEILGRLRVLFTRFAPDLILVLTLQSSLFYFLKVPERERAPIAVVVQEPTDWGFYRGGFTAEILAEATRVIAVSEAILKSLRPDVRSKASVILNGLADPGPPLAMPIGEFTLYSAGRVEREKGFDVVLDALAELGQLAPRWTLAGAGRELDSLRSRAAVLGLSSKVEFPGRISVDEVYLGMDRSHAVVVPSRWPEPFGLVALQGMLRARPVIASEVGGLPEIVTHLESGWLVPPDSPADLARVIHAMRGESGRITEIGLAGRDRALAQFGFHRYVDDYVQLIHSMAG